MPDDTDLLERMASGDGAAFDELVRKYQGEMYYLALRMVRNREDAEELAQQVFVKAFRKIGTFEKRSSFRTWLYQVAINECRTFLRRKKETSELDEGSVAASGESPDTLKRLIREEAAAGARELIETLPEKQKIVVTLRIFHEMGYSEIGKIAGCSEETAKVNFHYGIENIRKKMKESGIL